MLIPSLVVVVLALVVFDYRDWRRNDGVSNEPVAYICYRLGHTRPFQKATGPASELDRDGNRPFACRRCGLVFGRSAPRRGTSC